MGADHVCIGGHDLDDGFRAVRLLDPFGDNWTSRSRFMVGDTWHIQYRKFGNKPPHVEDVWVDDFRWLESSCDLHALVLERAQPWAGGPEVLFHRTVRHTPSGTTYISSTGLVPPCSTGYWVPNADLTREVIQEKVRFVWAPQGTSWRISWVGVQESPERIEAGSLVRLSLSRLFKRETAPEGYYVQISGVIETVG
jgi:hypothetical protein